MTMTRRLSFTAAALACLQFAIARAPAADSQDGDPPPSFNRSILTIASATDDDSTAGTTKTAQSNRENTKAGRSSRNQPSLTSDSSSAKSKTTDSNGQPAASRPRIQQATAVAASTSGDSMSSVRAGSRFDANIAEPKLLPPNVTGATQAKITPPASDWPAANSAIGKPTSYSSSSGPATNDWNRPQRSTRSAAQSYQGRVSSADRNSFMMAQTPAQAYPNEHTGRSVMGNSSVTTSQPETISPGESMDFSGGGCSDCAQCGQSCGFCFNPCGCCGWYGDVDYLLVRPSFSENQGFLQRTTTQDQQENTTVTDRVVHQDFDYNSSVRTYLGYRFSCGDEIRFTYWNFGDKSHLLSGQAPADGSVVYAGHLEIVTSEPGQRLVVSAGLQANVYDIEYIKCACQNSGCCDCDCCPPWTLKYSAGIRIADVRRGDNTVLLDPDGTEARSGLITADFIGAGPRVGIEGRRFFGDGGFSLFARSNLSLLLGEYDSKETRKTPATNPTTIENYFDSHDRLIPVAEIELGGTWQLGPCVNLSAGYLFQAWWDLGQFEQIQGNVFLNPIDDSNILSFDGLFARLEICF
jgi:hypothetical protein